MILHCRQVTSSAAICYAPLHFFQFHSPCWWGSVRLHVHIWAGMGQVQEVAALLCIFLAKPGGSLYSMSSRLLITSYVVWFPYGKYMAGKEKLDRLQNVLCQTSRMQRIWESGVLTWLCIYSSKKKKKHQKRKALCHILGLLSPLCMIQGGRLWQSLALF